MGAIPTKYKEVDFSTCRFVTECSEEIPEDVAIVIDRCTWAATARGIPTEKAPTVYSGDAEGNVGVFSQRSLRFSKKVLDGNALRTVQEKVFKLKEETQMDFSNLNADALQQQLSGMSPAATFNDAATAAKPAATAGKGTLICFITKTNSTIKAALKDPTKVGPDGKAMKGVHDPAQIVFKNAAPGQIIGAIVEIPTSSGGRVVKVLDKDEAQMVMAKRCGGVLTESEAVMGRSAASQITLKSVAAKGQNAPAGGVRTSFALKSRLLRSTVLTEGNYLPMKVFKTCSLKDGVQNNVMKLFSGKRSTDELAPEYQDAVAGGVVNMAKLTNLNAFNIPCYNNRKEQVKNPVLPVVEEYVKKSGATGFRFKTEANLNDIMNSAEYKKIVDATQMPLSELVTQLTSKFSKRKNVVVDFDVEEFLENVKAGRVLNGKKDADGNMGVVDFDAVMRGIEDVI